MGLWVRKRTHRPDLLKRVWQHRSDLAAGCTKQTSVKLLVWYETHTDMREAIIREKQRKRWNRDWKINLIESTNPAWCDLHPRIVA